MLCRPYKKPPHHRVRPAWVRVGDGPRHGLPERSTASLRAVLREGMARTGKDHADERILTGEIAGSRAHQRREA